MTSEISTITNEATDTMNTEHAGGGEAMLKTVAIGDLQPNPFRRLDEYPIQREKVDALKESISSTGFWGTIVARPAGRKYEIAFGHHRLTALLEIYKARDTVEVIVRELSNEQMLQMMARENMEEWGTSAWVELETIRAVIDAYGKGEIALPPVPAKSRTDMIRYVSADSRTHSYTKGTVAEFLGWTAKHGDGIQPNNAAETAFKALDMIERGFLKEDTLRGLTREQMRELVNGQWSIYQASERRAEESRRQAETAEREAARAAEERERQRLDRTAKQHREQETIARTVAERDAKRFGVEAAQALRSGDGVRAIRAMAEATKVVIPNGKVHRVDDRAEAVARALAKFATADHVVAQDLAFIRAHRGELSNRAARDVADAFDSLILRLSKLRDSL
jgi:ParB/RepB/Spo0J family partition protein